MRGLRNRLSAIYQICREMSGSYDERAALAFGLIEGLADGTIQPQEALREWRARR